VTDWLNPVATLIASFGGAWAAFKLQASERTSEVRRKNVAAANQALFVMMRQANTLRLYQHDHINPHRSHPGRHLAIQATLPHETESLKFDFSSLDFLDQPKEQQLLFDLSIEERRYVEAIRAINARSEIILNQVHPRASAAGLLDGSSYGKSEMLSAIGQPLYNMLERLTTDMIWHVDRTSDSIVATKDKLLSVVRARYPDVKFVDFVMQDPEAAP
jgi:hypothetical protein